MNILKPNVAVFSSLLFLLFAVVDTAAAARDVNLAQDADSIANSFDLVTPVMTDNKPGPGLRVRQVAPEYKGTDVHHALYLPVNWKPGGNYPVIVEYTGNEWAPCGSSGKVKDANLGYGMSGGQDFIWVSLPCVEKGGKKNAVTWWGDKQATVDYCKVNLPRICKQFGGDPDNVFICGFSRGAIAVSYIGLADDEIAALWKGMFTHDHFDGQHTTWGYPECDRTSALVRLARLKGRPVLVCGKQAGYLKSHLDLARFTFLDVPTEKLFNIPEGKVIDPHTDLWMHKESEYRKQARTWLAGVLKEESNPLLTRGVPANKEAEDYLKGLAGVLKEESNPLLTRGVPAKKGAEDYLKLQYGMFLHFNMGTYIGRGWANGHEDPLLFAPDKLDCNQWADVAVKAGMKYGVLTTKHTGGWCLWDSKHTTHDITAFKNYKDGKGDVVREFVDAFRKRNLKVGFYYCLPGHFARDVPYARPNPPGKPNLMGLPPEAGKDQIGFIKKQMTELLTNYGPIDVMWLDYYFVIIGRNQFGELRNHIKSLQPNCLVLANSSRQLKYTDVISYELGPDHVGIGKVPPNGSNQIGEVCDMLSKKWFWVDAEGEDLFAKKYPDAKAVADYLDYCNLNNANLLLNVAPNKDGLIIPAYIERLEAAAKILDERKQMAAEIAERRGVEEMAELTASSSPETVNRIVDGRPRDSSRWVSAAGKPQWVQFDFPQAQRIAAATVYSGYRSGSAIKGFRFEVQSNDSWETIPGSIVTENVSQAVRVIFDSAQTTKRIRLLIDEPGPSNIARIREIRLWDNQ